MKKLAIKGHPTEGNKVIEVLKMLGGNNKNGWECKNPQLAYYIDNDTGLIEFINICNPNEDILRYTLKEFLEKFPYKVGDKVLLEGVVKTIKQACWDNTENEVIYKLETNVRGFSEEYYVHHYDLQPYKMEVTKEFYNKYCVNCGSQRCTAEGEWLEECRHYKEETMEEIKIAIPKGCEFVRVDDNNQQVVFTKIQPKYPKTYEDCIGQLPINWDGEVKGYKCELLLAFQKLLIARDVYWKIAGEQMGLGKPWEPDWNHDTEKYVIYPYQYLYSIDIENYRNTILAFPTREMRDAFYENFKSLIEKCKELL